MAKTIRAAAVQLETVLGNSAANIENCERLAALAVKEGAEWIAVPEFFNTGVAWQPGIAKSIEIINGPAASFLKNFSKKNEVVIGGSFLCRIPDGRVRNRYMAFVKGRLIGCHDKDLPTMWENAFYEGGDPDDTGVLGSYDDVRLGAAVCWEFMRTQTARRLQNKVDLIMGGSCWWSIPSAIPAWPAWIRNRWEKQNAQNSIACVQETARLVGSPIVHAAHCGKIRCRSLCAPLPYQGHFEGNASVIDAGGKILAHRAYDRGEGIVCADVVLEENTTRLKIPRRFWLKSRGVLPWYAWHAERWLGKRWYRRHVLERQ